MNRRGRRRRRRLAALGALAAGLLVVLFVVRGGGAAHRADPASQLRRAAPLRLRGSAASDAAGAPTDSRALAKLRRRLQRAFAGLDARTGVAVEDLNTGAALFDRDADVPRPPASLEKLYTTVTALNLLGPRFRAQTNVLGTGHLSRHGVWEGNLYLRGGGDPTLGDGSWNRLYMGGYGPSASDLAHQLAAAGIRRVSGWIYADPSLFDSSTGGPTTHYRTDIPDDGGQLSALVYDHGMSARGMPAPVFAAHELALTLSSMQIRARSAHHTALTPPGAVMLARVKSPPLSVLVKLMDVPSDDLIADLLVKQLGARFAGVGSLSAGAGQISADLTSAYHINPVIHDGSGLDREDSSSPAQIVSLLSQVRAAPAGALLAAALPTVGRQGTVAGIGLGTYAVGHCVAKTGTLSDVSNLAGYCTARDGHTLAFALMVDGPSNFQGIAAISKAVGAIASY